VRLDWVVVGGESGPRACPFDLEWARDIIRQCRAARTPVFLKQLGALPVTQWRNGDLAEVFRLRDRKGGDPEEWLKDLQVREYPHAL
jgi:hypothetical protein